MSGELETVGVSERLPRVLLALFASVALWSLWSFTIGRGLGEGSLLRAAVRVSVVLGPALIFMRGAPDPLGVLRNAGRGLLVGVAATVLWTGYLLLTTRGTFSVPGSLAIWLNFIVLSPFAEEVLFRHAALRDVAATSDRVVLVLVSALFFVALHFPPWLAAGQPIAALLKPAGSLLLYALAFSGLYLAGRSIWAAALPHWANNFVLAALE